MAPFRLYVYIPGRLWVEIPTLDNPKEFFGLVHNSTILVRAVGVQIYKNSSIYCYGYYCKELSSVTEPGFTWDEAFITKL